MIAQLDTRIFIIFMVPGCSRQILKKQNLQSIKQFQETTLLGNTLSNTSSLPPARWSRLLNRRVSLWNCLYCTTMLVI